MTFSRELTGWQLVADDGSVTVVRVPGTVTQAFAALDADLRTWVFRTVLDEVPEGPVDLVLDGVATSYEVVLDGLVLAVGRSMFAKHRIDVSALLRKGSVLEIRCLPLATALPEGKPPRARWRTRLVEDNSLRLIRTTLLGRCPGIVPGPPVVGPWRPVRLSSPLAPVVLRARVEGGTGVLTVECDEPSAVVTCAGVSGPPGELRIPDVALWWPHTHGEPVLHDVVLSAGGASRVVGRVGFRSLVNASADSVDLVVNGVPVWLRGAVWTPPGLLAGLPEDPFETVRLARDAGMNMLRVPGLAPYESAAFFDACDELGVLVWHDLALANLDVPHDLLHSSLVSELDDLLAVASGRPSLAVVCGGSETAQQVAMLGLPPDLWRSPLLDDEVPALVGSSAVWVPNSPSGGALPFRVSEGVAHYFGVGGYRRPLSDVRTSSVSFAAECLAFSNPPGEWVPHDNGSDWDFADVREHYAMLLGRPSGAVVGEVMSAVFGEWRRAASGNRGGLVLWLRDPQPGAGWGVVSCGGVPKAPWWHLRRSLAPRAVWLVDEGLDGVAVHLANDSGSPWVGGLRIALYREDSGKLEEITVPLEVAAHDSWSSDVEGLLGHFVDLSWAYRFGPPSVAAVVATMEDGRSAPAQAFFFPVPRSAGLVPADAVTVEREGTSLVVACERLLDGVRISAGDSDELPDDNYFCLEPGRPRRVAGVHGAGSISALCLDGAVDFEA
jgi:beta-mannosidase